MGLISTEVEINANGNTKYYENLGYKIPKVYDNYKWVTKTGTKIKVKVSDLPYGSNTIVKVKCDCCGKERDLQYVKYMQNIERNNGLYLCTLNSEHKDFSLGITPEMIRKEIKNFLNKNDRFPLYNEFTKENNFTFTYQQMHKNLKRNNIDYKNLLSEIDFLKAPSNINYYDKYIEYLKDHLNKTHVGLYTMTRTHTKIFTPDVRWLITNCPDENVVDVETFLNYLGIKPNELTKEECAEQIYEMQKKFDRPLMYDDFRNSEYRTVSISYINKYWGSLNKMKEELGLEIVQESMMDKSLTKEQFDVTIDEICEYVRNDNRNFITTREINNNKNWSRYWSLNKYALNYYNMTFSDFLKQKGVNLGKQGNGTSFYFEDGEHTTSFFEYMFSKFLRNHGFVYNKDYFRDVKYKTFIKDCKNNMNCDYVLNINNENIYIEIAGIIEAYKTWYYENREITVSKSKDNYRIKLSKKEKMLKEENLKYYILFPCDLTNKNFEKIISNPSLELKHEIENFHKNNIDWNKVKNIGELDYSKNVYKYKN